MTELERAQFTSINSESDVHVIESLCPGCELNGETRLMLVMIPYFREVILSSFECPHCGLKNTEVQSGAEIPDRGVTITLNVKSDEDLRRQVIKSEHCEVLISSVELVVPARSQPALSTTVEGLVTRVIDNLESDQPSRLQFDPELYDKLESYIERLKGLLIRTSKGESWQLQLRDDSGLSFVESSKGPMELDSDITLERYERTTEQLNAMGFFGSSSSIPDVMRGKVASWDLNQPATQDGGEASAIETFKSSCGQCGGNNATQRVCQIEIPGFKTCLIMAFLCDDCGFKDTEVKPSGEIGSRGRLWRLSVEGVEDLNRDVIKSNFASIALPEIEFECGDGTLGGVFTTVEGLIERLRESLEKTMPFTGDSSEGNATKIQFTKLLQTLTRMRDGTYGPFILELRDAADCSFIGERRSDILLRAGMKPSDKDVEFEGEKGRADLDRKDRSVHDARLVVGTFDRTQEDDENIGLAGINTEDY